MGPCRSQLEVTDLDVSFPIFISAHQLHSHLQTLVLIFYIAGSATSLQNQCKRHSATVSVASYLRYSFWNVVSLSPTSCSSPRHYEMRKYKEMSFDSVVVVFQNHMVLGYMQQ